VPGMHNHISTHAIHNRLPPHPLESPWKSQDPTGPSPPPFALSATLYFVINKAKFSFDFVFVVVIEIHWTNFNILFVAARTQDEGLNGGAFEKGA